MPKTHRVIPIKAVTSAQPAKKVSYDCTKCPGYCCSYPLIEIGKRDIARLAKHFELTYEQAEQRFTRYDKFEKVRALRRKKDQHFGRTCTFFDTRRRRCTIYEARPGTCRDYPDAKYCGYYEFLKFEREQQDDPKFIAKTGPG